MKGIKVSKEEIKGRGIFYTFEVNGDFIEILFGHHALERAQKWQLYIEQIAETLIFPDEVVKGHFNRFIAQKFMESMFCEQFMNIIMTSQFSSRFIFHMPIDIIKEV